METPIKLFFCNKYEEHEEHGEQRTFNYIFKEEQGEQGEQLLRARQAMAGKLRF